MDFWCRLKNMTKIFFAVLFIILLAGCAEKVEIEKEEPVKLPPDPTNVLIDRLDAYIVHKPTKMGDVFVLAIPKSKLFNKDSANFSANNNELLNNIAALLRCYEKVDVRVASYISDQNIYRAKSLARKEASQVVNYLWTKGIDARLAYADGYVIGHKKSLVGNIVISFQVFDGN
jgi:outer membrane protein OmpA-like peptidoglycan-associated protein